jgi:hypothetical protein
VTSVSSAARRARELVANCDYEFTLARPRLKVRFWLFLQGREAVVIWRVLRLGASYPGGSCSLLSPEIEFLSDGASSRINLPLLPITSHAHRPRMTGKKAFFRVRGWHMPRIPLTLHFGLPMGKYEVRFRCGVQVVADLDRYAPAYSREIEEIDQLLGHIVVSHDLLDVEGQPINELQYVAPRVFARVNRFRAEESETRGRSLNPEHFFQEQLIEPARRINLESYRGFFPSFRHDQNRNKPAAPFVQNQRVIGGYCGSLALAYRLTGKAAYRRAARYAFDLLQKNIWRTKWGWGIGLETFREGENLLEFGICAQNAYEFYKVTTRKISLTAFHRVLRSWPYHKMEHLPFIEVDRNGKEIHPSYPFNMVAVGCAAMYLVGKVFDDEVLQRRVWETVHCFLLPMMEDDGHWEYAYHYEERRKYPEPNGYHYDMFTKMNLARLLEYDEWREDEGFMEAMLNGINFTLRTCAKDESRLLRWSDLYTSGGGPQFAINHAGMMAGYLGLLAKHVDMKYMRPLERTIRFLYSERDRRDLPPSVDWRSDWMHYHVLSPLLKVREYGWNVEGKRVDTLTVRISKS